MISIRDATFFWKSDPLAQNWSTGKIQPIPQDRNGAAAVPMQL